MKITRFEDIECWQEARNLVNKIYSLTKENTFKKDLRLSGQVQAAAASVMGNIAEGFVRRSKKEFIQFLFIALSSAAESIVIYILRRIRNIFPKIHLRRFMIRQRRLQR